MIDAVFYVTNYSVKETLALKCTRLIGLTKCLFAVNCLDRLENGGIVLLQELNCYITSEKQWKTEKKGKQFLLNWYI